MPVHAYTVPETSLTYSEGNPLAQNDKKAISRRRLIKGAGIAGTATLLAACDSTTDSAAEAPAVLRKKRTLKMVTTWPKNFPGLGTAAEKFARRVEALSDGQMTIRVYAAGELVSALGAFDAAAQGKADMYHGVEYYWQGKSPAFNFFAAVPMGMTAQEITAWIRVAGGQQLWDELAGNFNIKPFLCGNSGVQMGGWFKEPINSTDDFKGLRIRMPGLGGEVMKRMGATPVTKAGGEIFQALSQGNIDATEWVGPWNDLAFGFHTIVKNYYYPGIHEAGTALSLGLNKDVWDDMSPLEQAIISNAAAAQNDETWAEFNANNAHALNTLTREHDVKLQRFSDDILARMGAISLQVLQETAQHDPLTARVFESFRVSRNNSMRWGEIAEEAFAAARRLTIR